MSRAACSRAGAGGLVAGRYTQTTDGVTQSCTIRHHIPGAHHPIDGSGCAACARHPGSAHALCRAGGVGRRARLDSARRTGSSARRGAVGESGPETRAPVLLLLVGASHTVGYVGAQVRHSRAHGSGIRAERQPRVRAARPAPLHPSSSSLPVALDSVLLDSGSATAASCLRVARCRAGSIRSSTSADACNSARFGTSSSPVVVQVVSATSCRCAVFASAFPRAQVRSGASANLVGASSDVSLACRVANAAARFQSLPVTWVPTALNQPCALLAVFLSGAAYYRAARIRSRACSDPCYAL
mmetsp:Transcript_4679/g.9003  ORF Transcript_4679/g.9003 Transcript_4679/m.9003 type:complete len:300 (-) Transcript_4679:3339-4238(-)